MSTVLNQSWNGNTSVTVTGGTTLANATSATSAAVDNSTFLGYDVVLTVTITTAASAVSATGYLEIYCQASMDNSVYPDATNDVLVAVISAVANSTSYTEQFSVAKTLLYGPIYSKYRVLNQTGAALTAMTVTQNLLKSTSV